MIYKYEEYKSIFIIDSRITKEYFLKKCSVEEGKYAEDLFSRMYDMIMSEIKYLDDEFVKYYKVEYDSFEDFLHKKYYIPFKICDELIEYKRIKSTLVICEKDDLACGHYQLLDIAFSDDLIERVFNILEMTDYEN